jgi:hypothetical protein
MDPKALMEAGATGLLPDRNEGTFTRTETLPLRQGPLYVCGEGVTFRELSPHMGSAGGGRLILL